MGRPSRYKKGYASVTEIIGIIDKPGLRYWYGKFGTSACEAKKKSSQNVGHNVHAGIEKFLRGTLESECGKDMTNDQKIMLSHLTDWCRRKKIKPIALEEVLVYECKEHKEPDPKCWKCQFPFAGTPDVICTFNGGKSISVVDWKTDSMPKTKADTRERVAKYGWQMAGYAIAYEEQFKVKINKAYVIRASKDLQFAEYYFSDLKQSKKEFKMLREIFRTVRGK